MYKGREIFQRLGTKWKHSPGRRVGPEASACSHIFLGTPRGEQSFREQSDQNRPPTHTHVHTQIKWDPQGKDKLLNNLLENLSASFLALDGKGKEFEVPGEPFHDLGPVFLPVMRAKKLQTKFSNLKPHGWAPGT